MDEPFAVDATHNGILTAAKSLQEKATEPSSRPINEGIKCAQKIAKISVLTLLSIGIVESLNWPSKRERSRNCRRDRFTI